MTRVVVASAGNDRIIELQTKYSKTWSETAKRNQPIEAAHVTTAEFNVKTNLTDADGAAVISKTQASGIAITSGIVTITLDDTDTDGLSGNYYATLRLRLATGAVVDWTDNDFSNTPYFILKFEQGAVLDGA